MVRIKFQHSVIILYWFIDPSLLFIGAASYVVRTSIFRVQLHQIIAISDRLFEHPLLQVGRTAYEKRLFMTWVILKLLRADWDQVVYVEGLAVNGGTEPCHGKLAGACWTVALNTTAKLTVVGLGWWHRHDLLGGWQIMLVVRLLRLLWGVHWLHLLLLLMLKMVRWRWRESDAKVIIDSNVTKCVTFLDNTMWASTGSDFNIHRVYVRGHVANFDIFDPLLGFLHLLHSVLLW